ncbi:uroporphyrinogen decarboxylase [Sandaracinus amylolyticus]|uniref:uroporphyrinogen decarboxylase n=1 Tax=Sandaracinus amylolyticus TaxID=927083 RepID=UPI001F016C05|nr:uroporphyrinogen decarboxylase [Sandaracinus amylolyticus]UJR81620.1 Uroporphyrinogen III decarboxylase [Sandaracinus amylolyticus]
MSVFLDACRGKPTPYTPVWLMRQAGRYQPSYRAIREKVSFLELCHDPDLCAQVALRAVDDLGVDAAIVFADILLVLEPLGIGFEFTKDDGPRIERPVRLASDVDRVSPSIDANASLGYVMESVRRTKKALAGRVPLIGFSGAPFTLASYVIEGGGSREYSQTKRFMYADEGAWHELMRRLSSAITAYLLAQIDAGAEAVQLFDSWVGALGPDDYARYVQPHVASIFAALGDRVPAIHFGTGNPALYPLMKQAGGHVIGLDQRCELGSTWRALGDVAVQGNMDPIALLAPREVMIEKANAVLRAAGGRPGHVFNLGHGVVPQVDLAQARALVDHVHEASSR